MRKKKFSKKRFYRRLEAQNKNTGYIRFDTAHPQRDYSVIIDLEAWKVALERAGKALGQWCTQLNDSLKPVAEYLATDEGKAALAKAQGQKRTLEKRRYQVSDWDVMQSGYPDCQIYPDFRSNIEVDLIRKPLYSKRRGRGGYVEHEALGFDESFQHLQSAESAENLRADGLFFNAKNSAKQPEPKPEFVPPPPLEKIGASEPENDSGLFGWCFLHMAAIVACALLLCGILQKLSH
ncbi:hypothetical protein [Acinetobacter johnsonii]|uniref:hypothetical protein n=1 Tax=Acinetobacter johnsonii TaxID=40214 RepID=UPI001D196D03|nr:hypothetical protein [Acinetobacter johnsonii]